MKTKIINSGETVWELVIDEPEDKKNKKPRVLMRINSFFNTGHYIIHDYRYSSYPLDPDYYLEHDTSESIILPSAQFSLLKKFVTCEINFNEKDPKEATLYCWSSYDGIVIKGHDRPYTKNTHTLKNSKYVWSYQIARKKLKEGQNFWEQFTGSWKDSKIDNPNKQFSSMKVRNLIEEELKK